MRPALGCIDIGQANLAKSMREKADPLCYERLGGRSLDSDSRDETARVYAQDDGIHIYPSGKLPVYLDAP
jgi:hypothetical protein